MKYNESNFTYLKETVLSEYYQGLVQAECAYRDYPIIAKAKVRDVLEAFIRNLGTLYGIGANIPTGSTIKLLRKNKEFNLPEEIYDYIQIVRVNGIGITLYRSENKIVEKNTIEILELVHKIFIWYLDRYYKKSTDKFSGLDFIEPRNVQIEQDELSNIKRNILLKENQINNLREKIIELAEQSKSVGELAKIILAIKKEKSEIEEYALSLEKGIKLHRYELEKLSDSYEKRTNELDSVRKECIEKHRLLSEMESALVRAELDNQNIQAMISEIEETDEIINEKGSVIENQLERIRYIYEECVSLTNRFQDDKETIEFTHDERLKKVLSADELEINSEFSIQNTRFYNEINEYNKCIDEVRKKAAIFKEIINDKIKKSIKYKDFFNAFSNLSGTKLRILYSMISNWKTNSYNILSNPKEWLLNINNNESFIDIINNTLEEIKDVSDDQIKLLLYYMVIKVSNKKSKDIRSRKNYIKILDGIVDEAYRLIVDDKDFNYYLSKTHSVEVYYLKRVLDKLKNRYKNIKIKDDLIWRIYTVIKSLSIKNEMYFAESLKVDITNEQALMNNIKKQPFEYLATIIEIGELEDYKSVYSIIFEFLREATTNNSHEITGEHLSLDKFLRGQFRIMLFISDGERLNNKYVDEILPIFVGELLVSNSLRSSNQVNFECYYKMLDVLKERYNFYEDKFNEKEGIDIQIDELLKEKSELEDRLSKLLHKREILNQKYSSYEYEFKKIVLSSEKSRTLASYEKYKEYENKKEQSNSNDFFGEGSIISSLVEQASKKLNDSNLMQIESRLMEEAKNSSFFDKESRGFVDIQNDLDEIDDYIQNNKSLLNENEQKFLSIKSKSDKIHEQLETLKDIYPDIA